MPITQDDLWSALESIGTEDGEADKIAPPVIAKLIELRFVELTAVGQSLLTNKITALCQERSKKRNYGF
jgi:hypothetical protein